MSSPPTPPTPSSPPSYSHLNTPPRAYPQPPAFRSRRSAAAIIPIHSTDDSDSRSISSASPISQRSEVDDAESVHSQDSYDQPCHPAHALPPHMRSNTLSRVPSNASSLAEEGEATPLLSSGEDGGYHGKWYKGPVFVAAFKLGILFAIFTAIVGITFYWGMPKLDEEDKGTIKLPRSFADLQALNVQTFSLPGSMYISILFGAAYGIMYGLLLSCICESVGSLFCYSLSAVLAPPLLTLPFYRARVETWRTKIMGDPKKGKKVTWDSIFAILLVLRIAPFPPHWIANFVAPHLGIGMFLFWSSCFIGIAPVSVIHVTIGSSLDGMTSAADFHILSLRNILGLSAVIIAVLIPVGLKRIFKKDLGDLGEAEEALASTRGGDREINVPAVGQSHGRMYHAIDSGVVLATPSKGNGIDMRRKLVKSQGRILEIIPDHESDTEDREHVELDDHSPSPLSRQLISFDNIEEPLVDDNAPGPSSRSSLQSTSHRHDYIVFDPANHFHKIQVKPHRQNSLKGYGTIEQPAPVMGASERAATAAGMGWWPWARDGVA
ncbi:transmembrane protein [Cryptococcus deuterogattii 99/473]|uniref:Transmembrane protein n=1 Tax=Cryptococcus deuterogattii Ram5 TaxID=1296110 RepID=A0A0D0V9U1_9TREE|nr:transmembrane protein [Cryptococcus deuterogattii Ram5]KIR98452.1 transmembrane protein [Cryptococcus deuterogattii 2001/935-1]KIY56621.1 transmembrane protein [Cryptococcus deuterogattii 99/473]